MNVMLSVALGGAVGAVGRYWISTLVAHAVGAAFPWGTLAVNVLGCAAMGALIQLMAFVWSPPEELRALLTVGMMGALTTFSAFSVEIVLMLERGQWLTAALYIVLSVVLSVGAMLLAMAAMRAVLA
jgi:CrcB protein